MATDAELTALQARVGQTYTTLTGVNFRDSYGSSFRIESGSRVRVSHVSEVDGRPMLTVWAVDWPGHPFAQVDPYSLSSYPETDSPSARRTEIEGVVRDILPNAIQSGPGITVTGGFGRTALRIGSADTSAFGSVIRPEVMAAAFRELLYDPVERLLLSMQIAINDVPGDTPAWVKTLNDKRRDVATWGAFADWCAENRLFGWEAIARVYIDKLSASPEEQT